MARILRRPRTGAEIADIRGCIAEDGVLAADAWADRPDGRFLLPSNQPKIGRARDDLSPGLRSMPFGCRVIFYEPLPDGIGIARALHPARDFDGVLDPGPDLAQ